MQYLMLIYSEETIWGKMTKAEHDEMHRQFDAFGKEFAGKIQGGNALQPTAAARSVRVRDGSPLATDGPFAETKEQLGGYYLIEAANPEEAAAIAAKIPAARYGTVEVRPILKFS